MDFEISDDLRALQKRTREFIAAQVLGMLAALSRPDEPARHVRVARKNGVTKAEIRECLQVAVYAGMPAGMGAFKIARQVFAALECEAA